MPPEAPDYPALCAEVRRAGLEPRGGLLAEAGEGLSAEAVWLLLLGAVGGSLWPAFATAPEAQDGAPDPLDRWSRRVVEGLAARLGARALYPFGGPPYRPFLRWARRAEGLSPSPLGMLMHPRHGLWHAYRGALAFAAVPAGWEAEAPLPSPCRSCAARPCLSTCPVGAFSAAGYDVAACRRHLARPEGADCLTGGCRARRACPQAPELRYAAEQAEFHMRAFLGARTP